MIGTFVVLLVVGAITALPDPKIEVKQPRNFVRSNEQYSQAKFFIQSNLPLKPRDIHDPAQRQHQGFAVLIGVISDLVDAAGNASQEKYDPMVVVGKSIPSAMQRYMQVASRAQDIVSDLELKINVVTDYMNAACGSKSVQQCNEIVEERVRQYPSIYKAAADLLLQLGAVSEIVNSNKDKVEEVTKDHGEIGYLLNNADTAYMQVVVNELQEVVGQSRNLKFRRIADM